MKNTILLAALLCTVSVVPVWAEGSNWMFRPGRYSHDPATGQRVTQFAPTPRLAALPDSRPFASGYRRSRVVLRGAGGSSNEYYRVENWSGGAGGVDAQWERYNDVWQRSVLSGGGGYGSTGFGGGAGYGAGYGGYGGASQGYGGYGGAYQGYGGYRGAPIYGPGAYAPGYSYGYGYGQGSRRGYYGGHPDHKHPDHKGGHHDGPGHHDHDHPED